MLIGGVRTYVRQHGHWVNVRTAGRDSVRSEENGRRNGSRSPVRIEKKKNRPRRSDPRRPPPTGSSARPTETQTQQGYDLNAYTSYNNIVLYTCVGIIIGSEYNIKRAHEIFVSRLRYCYYPPVMGLSRF